MSKITDYDLAEIKEGCTVLGSDASGWTKRFDLGELEKAENKVNSISDDVEPGSYPTAAAVREYTANALGAALEDIKVPAAGHNNGQLYQTPGDAVRGQVAEVENYLGAAVRSVANLEKEIPMKLDTEFEEGAISTQDGSDVKSHEWIRSGRIELKTGTRITVSDSNVLTLYIHKYNDEGWDSVVAYLADGKTFEASDNINIRMAIKFVNPALLSLGDAMKYFKVTVPLPLTEEIESVQSLEPYIYEKLALDKKLMYSDGTYSTPGFISSSNGEINSYGLDKAVCTDYISIEFAKNINGIGSISNVGCVLAFYDSYKKYMPDISIIPVESSAIPQSFDIDLTDERYKNAKYIRASHYRPYTDAHLSILYGSRLQRLLDEPRSPLAGKVINVIGDSLSSTDYSRPAWWEMISADTGCSINDYGWSGTTLSHTDNRHLWGAHFEKFDANELGYDKDDPATWKGGGCMVERVDRLDASADAVILMGGTNDNGVPRGAWGSTATDTFFGAINTIIPQILRKFAGKPVLICTPIKRKDDCSSDVYNPVEQLMGLTDSDALSLQLRAEAIRLKCRQYGVPYLDLYNESGINGVDAAGVYYRIGDSLHPSNAGQTRLKSLIQNKLETLF